MDNKLAIIGLILDIIGVIILTYVAIRISNLYVKRHKNGAPLGISKNYIQIYENLNKLSIFGLFIILIGFILQILNYLI